jgi:predicted ATP-grasp superfamily ATP-dependent carboligase
MRVFIYEHLCAGGAAAPSLVPEGRAMLTALLEDFGRLPGVDTLPAPHGGDEAAFRRLAAAADWTLVVAPECDGVLAERLRWANESGGRVLGPTPGAARLAGDKLRLAGRLHAHGVPTPPTVAWPAPAPAFPAVCKPRHGAGSQATFLVRNERELDEAVRRARAEGWHGELIVQPHVAGFPASVAFLTGPGRRLALPPAAQQLSDDGRFHYWGGSLPLPPDLADRAAQLAAAAVDAVEGWGGYIGVDVVLGAAADGDAVIEINPRPTTSYVGLRALALFNLAEALLAVASGRPPPAMAWRPGPVRFSPDGGISADP